MLLHNGYEIEINTLYLGVNLSVFSPDKSVTKEWDVTFMGRLEPMKAVDLFPEMLAKLREKYPKLKFMMTGEGSLREVLLEEFESMGVTDNVEYLGVVEIDRIPELINKSRIFIYPSREEPFGLSILEAMACEVPVIASNVFGPGEIITQDTDGLLVPPDNIEALIESVQVLLEDEKLRRTLGSNARKTVTSKFDISSHFDQLIALYKKLIKSKKRTCGNVEPHTFRFIY